MDVPALVSALKLLKPPRPGLALTVAASFPDTSRLSRGRLLAGLCLLLGSPGHGRVPQEGWGPDKLLTPPVSLLHFVIYL